MTKDISEKLTLIKKKKKEHGKKRFMDSISLSAFHSSHSSEYFFYIDLCDGNHRILIL